MIFFGWSVSNLIIINIKYHIYCEKLDVVHLLWEVNLGIIFTNMCLPLRIFMFLSGLFICKLLSNCVEKILLISLQLMQADWQKPWRIQVLFYTLNVFNAANYTQRKKTHLQLNDFFFHYMKTQHLLIIVDLFTLKARI